MLDSNVEVASSPILYYRCSGLHAVTELLTGRGAKLESAPHLIARMPDHELWMAFFRDPDGNLLALMEEIR